ncbi:hypothetical protein NP493_1506g00003 [Ridgeia piscesae]|uniref:Uncharacterized protein n=1 Tax=Ridgeia piscesae TaxID=27915 RepID=A0AAD9K0W6_RIDPI|nr:hypothetical protein NP493_1506g00003 [Ridgeia piscesae]
MAATGCENFVVVYVLLLIHVFVRAEQPCELAKIHVQGEDGNLQVLTMKQLRPTQCGTCRRGDEALSCGASVDAAASRYSARAVPRTLDLAPRVTLVFDEILIGCDRLTDDVSAELCAQSKLFKKQAGSKTGKQQKDLFQQYSKAIVKNNLLPFETHHKDTDLGVAYGVVLMSMGYADESVEHFTKVIKAPGGYGNNMLLYYVRGIAYARKGLPENGLLAIADFSKAIDMDPSRSDTYTKRAEIYLALGHYTESLVDINKAIEIQPAARLYFLRGTIEFAFDNLAAAEQDFRRTLTDGEEEFRLDASYYLGLTLYYRGKVRNSIGTFKEAIQLKKDYIEAHTGLGQAYRELGDYKEALKNFNVSLCLDDSHQLTVRLRGSMHYHAGETLEALDDFNKCLSIDPNNKICRYMQGLSLLTLGRFYEGIKTQTKGGYQEQPGLQPQISDVAPSMFMNYRPEVQALVCRARQLGGLTQVTVDGFLANSRLNLAMGLAVIHIAQVMETVWHEGRKMKNGDQFNWRDMFDIAVQYRRLVDLEQAVFWLDSMPDENVKDGYTNDIHFIKGDTMNVRLIQYFELVFKLVKTMVDHYSGEGVFNYQEFKEDLEKVRSCEDLLNVAKTSQLNRQGFMVSTQVPSMKDKTVRHEGVILSLTGDLNGKLLFAINLATTKTRTTSYHAELDFMFNKLYQEIRKTGVNKTGDIDNVLNTILSLVYYFKDIDNVLNTILSLVYYFKVLPVSGHRQRPSTRSCPWCTTSKCCLFQDIDNVLNTILSLGYYFKDIDNVLNTILSLVYYFKDIDNVLNTILSLVYYFKVLPVSGHRQRPQHDPVPGVLLHKCCLFQDIDNVLNTILSLVYYFKALPDIDNVLNTILSLVYYFQDIDNVLNTILSLVYYFYNLMPLTRGSSVAAYSVAMGLILSLGWEVQGKIPTGKLLDIEAMLSGAPDAFIMVLKQWINVKSSSTPPGVTSHCQAMIKVKDAFPTVRSVLELLSLNSQSIRCTLN